MSQDGRSFRDDTWSAAGRPPPGPYYRHADNSLPPIEPYAASRTSSAVHGSNSQHYSRHPYEPLETHRHPLPLDSQGRPPHPASPVRADIPYDRNSRLPPPTSAPSAGSTWDRHTRPVSPTTAYPTSRSNSGIGPSYSYRSGGLQHSWEGSEPSTPRDRDPLTSTQFPPLSSMEFRERDRDWEYRTGRVTPNLPPPTASSHPAWTPNDPPPPHSGWPDTRDPRRTPIITASPSSTAEWDRRKTWVDDRASDQLNPPPLNRGAWERETPRAHDPIDDPRWRQDSRVDPYSNSRILPARPDPAAGYSGRGSQPLPPSPAFDPSFPPPASRAGYHTSTWSGPPASPSVIHAAYERDRPASRLSQPLGPPSEPLPRRPHARTGSGAFAVEGSFPAPPTAPRADREFERRERERDLLREIKREEPDEPAEWKPVAPPLSKQSTGSSGAYGNERSILPPVGSAHRPFSQNGYMSSPRTSTPSSYTQELPLGRYQLPPLGTPSQDRVEGGPRHREGEPTPYSSPSRRSSLSRPGPSRHSQTPDVASDSYQTRPVDNRLERPPSRGANFVTTANAGPLPTPIHQDQERHREGAMRQTTATERGDMFRRETVVDSMEVDMSPTTPRMPASSAGRPRLGSPQHATSTIPMDTREDYVRPPSERARSPDEPVRRASPEEEEEEEAPRRPRPARRPGRKRGGKNQKRAAEDMDLDDPIRQLLAAVMPPPHVSEAIGGYLKSNKRFEPDSGFDLVEEVLAQNRHLSDFESSRQPTSADELVDEVARSTETENLVVDYCQGTRNVIVAQIKRGVEDVHGKVRRLRAQYLALNKEWEVRCAQLDREKQLEGEKQALKTPIPTTPNPETPSATSFFTSGRATRRTAGGLGNLMADAVRSDLEFEQVMASLGNEDLVDPNILSIRNAATIPDMLSVQPRARPLLDVVYDDTNGVVDYPEQFYDVSESLGDWTEEEKEIFMEQFAVNGKQFGKIADHLPHKTAEQCVLFYYLSKKSLVDYGEVLNNKKYAKGRRKLARRNVVSILGKQKGNALLTDIRTTAGEATPADSPTGSPKNTDVELPPRRRGRPPLNGSDARTRPLRNAARGRRGASPESEAETPALGGSADEGSSSENEGEATENGRRTNKPRRAAAAAAISSGAATPAGQKVPKKGRPSSHWSNLERKVYLEQLALYGKSWYHIAQEVKTKTPAQCRNFYNANEQDMELDKIVKAWETKHKGSDSDGERGDKQSPSASSTPEESSAKVSGIEALRNIQTANAAHSKPADTYPSNGVPSLLNRPELTAGAPNAFSQTANVPQSRVFAYTSDPSFIKRGPYSNDQLPQAPLPGPPAPATFLPTPSSTVYNTATNVTRNAGGNPPPNNGTLPPKPSFSNFDSYSAHKVQGNQSRDPISSMTARPVNAPSTIGSSTSSLLPPKPAAYTTADGKTVPQLRAMLAISPFDRSSISQNPPSVPVDASNSMEGLD